MSFALHYDLNIFAIILLIALLLVIILKQEISSLKSNIFRLIIIFTIIMLTLEIMSWVFDEKPGETAYLLNFLSNFFFTALNTVVVSLWASYIDYTIYESRNRLRRRWFYLQPSIIVVALSIINIYTPILFEINENNVYSRLPLIWVSISLTFLIYLYVFFLVYQNRKKVNVKVLYGVMIFLSLPIIAGFLQLWFYGLLVIWPATAIALLFSYLIFETTSASRDFLTGAYTRMRAEEFIVMLLRKKKKFVVIMIDLDDFKVVNDTFGHHVGDAMLVEMTAILKKVFNKNAIVSRYGGDEFLVVVEGKSEGGVQLNRHQIQTMLQNSSNTYAQTQKFSYGISICNNIDTWTMESLITTADNNMYLDKAINKNLMRRKTDIK